jgi:glycosyltransferase 2 family protein
MTPMNPDRAQQPKLKFWQTRTARLGGSGLILALLLTFLPFRQVWSAIERIPPSLSLGLLLVYMFLHLLGVVKWRMLINVAGANLSFAHAVRCYYGGLFGNVFLPSLVGGDVVRGAMAFPVARSKAAIVMGSLIDRTQDVIGLGAIAGTGALLLPSALSPQSRKVFLVFAGVLALVGLLTMGILLTLPVRKFPFKIQRWMAKLRHAGRSMVGHWDRVLLCLGLGIVLQVSQIALNCWLGIACGMHVSFGVWLFAWPLAKISALLPLTQGGIGVREAALVALLVPFGVPAVLTAAAGLVFEAITTIGGLLAGFVAFVVGRLPATHTNSFPHLPAFGGNGDRTPLE